MSLEMVNDVTIGYYIRTTTKASRQYRVTKPQRQTASKFDRHFAGWLCPTPRSNTQVIDKVSEHVRRLYGLMQPPRWVIILSCIYYANFSIRQLPVLLLPLSFKSCHITPTPRSLHWLRITECIEHKLISL